jgi:hypothetical protein
VESLFYCYKVKESVGIIVWQYRKDEPTCNGNGTLSSTAIAKPQSKASKARGERTDGQDLPPMTFLNSS